jgi:hypothetical protein
MFATRNRLLLALAAGVLLPSALYAQQSNGTLSGRITAADGATGKAGVKIAVVEKSNNLQRGTVTDADGHWRIPALPVGEYKIIMTSGAETHSASRVVSLGVDAFVRFKWPAETGATVTVVETSAAAEMVNTTSAEIGVNVDSAALMDMPVLDRNVNTAAVLAPGVQVIQGAMVDPTKKNSTYIVSGGGQGRGTSFNVDGADNNSSDVGGAALSIPFDAIDQFQVVTNQYKAEFGRSNAGFMNVVTKSGGNEFAGALNAQYTNQGMRARSTDEGTKLANDSEIYSATVAGPIIKDKLFFMVSAEKTTTSASQTFDPRAVAAYPALGNSPSKVQKDNLYVKFDWNVNQNWLASFTIARYYDINSNEALGEPQALSFNSTPSMLGASTDTINKYSGKVTGNFGNVVWESNFNYFNYQNQIAPETWGDTGGFDVLVTNTGLTDASQLYGAGIDANAIQNTGVKRLEWKNEVTWVVGAHSVKGGFDWQQTSYPVENYFYPYPDPYHIRLKESSAPNITDAFSPTLTAADVARVTFVSPVQNPATVFHTLGAYLQDDWVINPNWSLSYGARLDWDTQLDAYKGLDPIYATIAANNPNLAGMNSSAPTGKKYFSPRLQVLYHPNGDDKLTIKAGYGKFTASTIDNVVGFSRGLYGNVNGFNGGVYTSGLGINQTPTNSSGQMLQLNGVDVVLPADLTPYNLANNTNGLATLFKNMTSQLTPAGISTQGRSLLASNFTYPTTQTMTLGVAYKINDASALDVTALYGKTKNNTVVYAADDSSAAVTDDYQGNSMGDQIFMSNQTATQRELQVKYTWHSGPMSLVATLDASYNTSSNGGSGAGFGNNGGADFYGAGATYAFIQNPERKAQGSQPLAGSFSWGYKFATGTNLSLLGQWHAGKWYDIYHAYSNDPTLASLGQTTLSNPITPAGTGNGCWNLDMGLRISQDIKFGAKMVLEPFLQISNILNNYDYGTNYYNTAEVVASGKGTTANPYTYTANPLVGTRMPLFQSNAPRTAAVGLRFTF